MKAVNYRLTSVLWMTLILATGYLVADEPPLLDVTVKLDLGAENGSTRGSLFEVYDDQGNVLAGAGFPDADNAQPKNNRRRLHFFLKPARLTAEIPWTERPTVIRCQVTAERMRVWQDSRLLVEQATDARQSLAKPLDRIVWGRGAYGRLQGRLLSRRSNFDRAFLGAYVKFAKIFGTADTIPARKLAIEKMLDRFAASGFRDVMPYVNTTSGESVYPSHVVAGQLYQDWDPLEYLIAAAKQRQLRVYPVFCVLACGHEESRGVLRTHPDWAVRSPEGKPIGYISPANAEARDWVTSMIDEVVRNYAIDGVLLDYLRYHNRPIRLDAASELDFKRFRQQRPDQPADKLLQAFREAALTQLARQISESIRSFRPDLQIAIYSWGPHVASQHRVGQAWPLWSREGYIDMVNISGYCYPENYGDKYLQVFSRRLGDAIRLNQQHHGRAEITFCLGTATSHGKIQEAAQVNDYLVRAGMEKVSGVAVFTWSTLTPFLEEVNRAGFIQKFSEQVR